MTSLAGPPSSPAARGASAVALVRLARDFAQVVIWDLDPSHFDLDANEFRPEAILAVDVAEPTSVQAAMAQTLDVVGHIDILVNNAGINGPIAPVWELDAKAWQRVLDINLSGVFNTCHTVVPHLRERGYGRIINMASMAGKEGNALQSAYSSAKAGVIAFTKSLGKELATEGITVNAIAPAIAETELFNEMTPEHIANAKSENTHGPAGASVRDRQSCRMDPQRRVLVHYRLHVRHLRWPHHLLMRRCKVTLCTACRIVYVLRCRCTRSWSRRDVLRIAAASCQTPRACSWDRI
jgi:NAD(P)-dependent dehydrogenase (short-subunit alcohol dehydrogenase family)